MAYTPPRRTLTGEFAISRSEKYWDCFDDDGTIYCFCDVSPRYRAIKLTTASNKNGNLGRMFYRCRKKKDRACRFFIWEDELEAHGWPGYPDDDDLLANIDYDELAAGPAPPPPPGKAPASTPPTSPQVTPNVSPVAKEDKKRPVEEGPARESPEEKKPRIEPPKVEEKAVRLEEDAVKREERVEEVKEEDACGLRRSKRVSVKPKRFDEGLWTE
ncbi:hypothetical protein NBRC10512_000188 [Rhodotorula toruloides]|uniref:RHTO0S28e01574g1_1 n=2 Tax=Rhodotorula toruloides TaxID=5286 RepID=A0A061BJQ9_RHOTO|nr:zinc finger, GRF-type protein [Rhodotorula toruloides NP11]EMS18627.1 zinc finger, GRF-type protein [Rhodotorula toruloides NP11]CDR49608.1 RHTO0S28e01574g1_1 [Rhodotorula toruloides]